MDKLLRVQRNKMPTQGMFFLSERDTSNLAFEIGKERFILLYHRAESWGGVREAQLPGFPEHWLGGENK